MTNRIDGHLQQEDRIAREENAHQNHECQHHVEVTESFDASLEAQPHAGAKHRYTGCHDEKLHLKAYRYAR